MWIFILIFSRVVPPLCPGPGGLRGQALPPGLPSCSHHLICSREDDRIFTSSPRHHVWRETIMASLFQLHAEGTAGGWSWQQYKSTPLQMAAGENLWLNADLLMPSTKIALHSFRTWVTDVHGEQLSPSRLYVHHWAAGHTRVFNPLCSTSLPGFIANGMPPLPAKMAISVEGGGHWGGVAHLIRLDGLIGARAQRECVECYYAPGKCHPSDNGTFACCGWVADQPAGRTFCPVVMSLPPMAVVLNYEIEYSTELRVPTYVETALISAPACQIFYPVLHEDGQPESRTSHSMRMPFNATLVVAAAHQHFGAINMTLSVNGVLVCVASRAAYHRLATFASLIDGWQHWLICQDPAYAGRAERPSAQPAPVGQAEAFTPAASREGSAGVGRTHELRTPGLRLREGDVLQVGTSLSRTRSCHVHA